MKNEKDQLAQKVQDLIMYNERTKDDCLKKLVVYKDKYAAYKTKVKQANQQLGVLKQRVAQYELQ